MLDLHPQVAAISTSAPTTAATASATSGHLPITEQHLVQWLAGATPGEQLIYHRGFLAIDTGVTSSQLPPSRRQMLLRVASRVRDMCTRGLVQTVQRRNGDGDFTYLVVARQRLAVARRRLDAAMPNLPRRGDTA